VFPSVGHSSPPAAHRSTESDAYTHTAPEPRLDGWNHPAPSRALDAKESDEHTTPRLVTIVDGADAAGRVRRPAKLAQRIDEKSRESVDAPGASRLSVAPRLTHGANDAEPDIRVRGNAQANADVSRARTSIDEIDPCFRLYSRRPLLGSLLRIRRTHRTQDGDHNDRDRATPGDHAGSLPHVARSRQSMRV
jgi:hypothetical protein